MVQLTCFRAHSQHSIHRSVAFYPSRILYAFLCCIGDFFLTYLSCLEAIPTEPNGGNHTRGFTSAAATPEAHEVCLEVCKALALTGVRVIGDDQFYAEVNSPSLIAVLRTKVLYNATGEENL
jgi:hypothetical protein